MNIFKWLGKAGKDPSKEVLEGIVEVLQHAAPRFPKGTTITCPKCNKHIGVANRDILAGESIRSDAWDGDSIVKFGHLSCPDDNAMYVKQGPDKKLIHTSEGWI